MWSETKHGKVSLKTTRPVQPHAGVPTSQGLTQSLLNLSVFPHELVSNSTCGLKQILSIFYIFQLLLKYLLKTNLMVPLYVHSVP